MVTAGRHYWRVAAWETCHLWEELVTSPGPFYQYNVSSKLMEGYERVCFLCWFDPLVLALALDLERLLPVEASSYCTDIIDIRFSKFLIIATSIICTNDGLDIVTDIVFIVVNNLIIILVFACWQLLHILDHFCRYHIVPSYIGYPFILALNPCTFPRYKDDRLYESGILHLILTSMCK